MASNLGGRSFSTGRSRFRTPPRGRPGCVEGLGDFVESVAEEVAVGVHGHGGGAVAEHLLDDFDVCAGCDREAGGGVAEFVWVESGDADGSSEDGGPERAATADTGEDEFGWSFAVDVPAEVVDEEDGDRDVSPFVGLGCPHSMPCPWTTVTEATIRARRRTRSRCWTRSAASSPNRTPV